MVSIVPELRRPERRELIRAGRKTRDLDTANRFAAVAKLAAPGRPSKSQVARELEIAISTVVSAARRFLLGGAERLYDQRVHNGRARKVDERFQQRVSAALYQTPPERGWERPTWTRELLGLEMARLGLPLVAVCTMGRILAALGARIGAAKPIVLCPTAVGNAGRYGCPACRGTGE